MFQASRFWTSQPAAWAFQIRNMYIKAFWPGEDVSRKRMRTLEVLADEVADGARDLDLCFFQLHILLWISLASSPYKFILYRWKPSPFILYIYIMNCWSYNWNYTPFPWVRLSHSIPFSLNSGPCLPSWKDGKSSSWWWSCIWEPRCCEPCSLQSWRKRCTQGVSKILVVFESPH